MKPSAVTHASDEVLGRLLWDYLRYEQPLQKADVIISLGSHDRQTAEWSAQLYREGWAPLVMFCGGRGRLTWDIKGNEADFFADIARGMGVPSTAILRDTTSTNTGENIVNAQKVLSDNGIAPQRIILVTKPYMLRRAYATFMKQWLIQPMPEVICSAIDKDFNTYGEGFESRATTIEIMVGDLQRIHEYPTRGFQIEQHIPDTVWQAYETLVKRGYVKQRI